MKILHLTSHDHGGAGRAALRLHQGLLNQGVDSQMIVQYKHTDLCTIHVLAQGKMQKFFMLLRTLLDQGLVKFLYKEKVRDIFSSTYFPSNKNLLKQIKIINPDIIHLHWINFGFINIDELLDIGKPILWSLHDENPYTGGCHYVHQECKQYKTYCHTCPALQSTHKYDLSYFNFKHKQKIYKKLNLTINGLSRWIYQEAKSSTLFRQKTIVNLPNTIDTNFFRPIDKNIARNILGIKTDKILLGFGAISSTRTERKGYLQLREALGFLPNKHRYKLVVFGSSHGEDIAGIDTLFLGHLYDDMSLTILYNSLDLFIAPSRAENLSNSIMESLSCGTPVVAFDIGGNSDMIIHKINGFLAKNTYEICEGILWCLQNISSLSENARTKIEECFSYNRVVELYIQLYSNIGKSCNNRGNSKKLIERLKIW